MRFLRRAVLAVALAPVVLVLAAGPAAADPARPGNVRSTVRTIEPTTSFVHASIRGGDSFLQITVTPGHELVVDDYADPPQPYLRVLADGTVEVNHSSRAYYQNRSRYSAEPPAGFVDGGPADWHRTGGGGIAIWHDHRVHWMARTQPPATDWQVPILLDGAPASILGHYEAVPAPSEVPWLGAALVTFVVLVLVGRRRPLFVALATITASALALPVAVAEGHIAGQGSVAYVLAVLPTAGVAAGAVFVLRRRSLSSGAFLAGGGLALGLWAVRRLSVLRSAILVTNMPAPLDRTSVAAGLAVAAAAIVTGVIAAGLVGDPSARPAGTRRAGPRPTSPAPNEPARHEPTVS